ncbi:hypothetical protein [Dysgonomonas sp. ZJ709]|uniref:hypothetical protein n=1 Tax=Dysgonomonas sp. ZJ709 TaxID=2709797 RepID=UPI0013ED3FD8|nr:hypothetical protein [Dysgonomonas sp. ZJ709]
MRYTDEQIIIRRTGMIINLLIVYCLAQLWIICSICSFEERHSREFFEKELEFERFYQSLNLKIQQENFIDETDSVEKALDTEIESDKEALTTDSLSQDSIKIMLNQLLKYYECTKKESRA